AGTVIEGIPATRKVPLPAPRTAMRGVVLDAQAVEPRYLRAMAKGLPTAGARSSGQSGVLRRLVDLMGPSPAAPSGPIAERNPAPAFRHSNLGDLARQIDWTLAPKRLQAGDLSALSAEVARDIRDVAASLDAVEVAKTLGLAPIMLVIGLL